MRGVDDLGVAAGGDEDVAGDGKVSGVGVVFDVVGLDAAVAVGDDDVAVEGVDAGLVGLRAGAFDDD